MPLTCSHPAAVLPFKRFARLNFAALVIGSMTPDAGYFIGERHLAKIAHHPIGTILIDIPAGLILLDLFYLVRRELCYILPSPHRNQLTPLANQKITFTSEAILFTAFSILLGTWTHIVWDQFTHDGTFLSRHIKLLRFSYVQIGPQPITIAYTLQYISTFVGGAILALYYFKWLRSQPSRADNERDNWRYLLWFVLGLLSLAIGTLTAIHLTAPVHEFKTFREFVYKQGIISVSTFTILIVVSAILCYRKNGSPSVCNASKEGL